MSYVNTGWRPQTPAPVSQADNGTIGAGHPAIASVQPTAATRVTVTTSTSVSGERNKNTK